MSGDVKPIPEGPHTLTPYLCVKDAARSIDFHGRAFGSTPLHMHLHVEDVPHDELERRAARMAREHGG